MKKDISNKHLYEEATIKGPMASSGQYYIDHVGNQPDCVVHYLSSIGWQRSSPVFYASKLEAETVLAGCLSKLNTTNQKHMNTRDILNERETQYGAFRDVSKVTMAISRPSVTNWKGDMPSDCMCVAINMIASKLARITCGDHTKQDSWEDIAGYAQLVVDELNREDKAKGATPSPSALGE
jgi:hypothetical protein